MSQKRTSTDLYDLIQTLNKTEKRHFRIYVSRGEKGEEIQYQRLFDILEAQSEFSDTAAMKKLKIQSRSRYNRLKNYLYTTLLESLEDYYRDANIDARFFHLMNRARILQTKSLHSQAGKLYKKAQKLADERGLSAYHLILERMELNRLSRVEDLKEMERYLEGYEERMKTYMLKAEDSVHLQMVSCKLTWLLRYADSNPEKYQDRLLELSNHDLLKSIKYPEDLEYRLYYDNFNGLVCMLRGMEEEDMKHRRSYLHTYQNNPEYIQRWPINYIIALGNMAESAGELGEYSELLRCTEEMRSFLKTYNIRNKSPIEPVAEIHSAGLDMDAWPIFDDQQKEDVFNRMLRGWRKKKHVTKTWHFVLAFGIARYRFEKGNYNRAADWINKIIQDPDDRFEAPIQFSTRLLHLLNQYELGHKRVLEHAIPHFREWLRKMKIKSDPVNLFLRTLKKQLHVPLKKERDVLWSSLLPELAELMETKEAARLLRRVDLLNWVAAKSIVLK